MEKDEKQNRWVMDLPLQRPQPGENVWPLQSCPAFFPRSIALVAEHECWFCAFADFHLTQRVALDVGICCWPHICMK